MWLFTRPKLATRTRKKAPANTHYHQHREAARQHITSRLEYFNQYYQLPYNRVAIRNQRRCWGSCSAKRNLNFSYKLLLLPPCLADYIVVHELCHLRELNHSNRFWAAVAEAMPDYEDRARTMRHYERTNGTSIAALQAWSNTHQADECRFCQADSADIAQLSPASPVR